MAYSPMGFTWANAVSETYMVSSGNQNIPILIAEAPATRSLIIRQMWSPDGYIAVDIEDAITGQTLPLISRNALLDGSDYTGGLMTEFSGWKGMYVLKPGDKLWAENVFPNGVYDSHIHWSGFYLN